MITSQTKCSDLFSDRIDKLTLIARLLKRKFEEFNISALLQMSTLIMFFVNVDNSVEMD